MADILPFKKQSLAERAKGKTMCKNGFHKWEMLHDKQFDVKQGKLVTVYKCKRCSILKNKAL